MGRARMGRARMGRARMGRVRMGRVVAVKTGLKWGENAPGSKFQGQNSSQNGPRIHSPNRVQNAL